MGQHPLDSHDPRFSGFWMAEEIRDAYVAAVYQLSESGAIETVRVESPSDGEPTLAMNPTSYVRCGFGRTWHSESPSILIIDGRCSDGRTRALELEFQNPATTNQSGAEVTLRSVDAESGWTIGVPFPLSLRKCNDATCTFR
jgi:hypothetical protein